MVHLACGTCYMLETRAGRREYATGTFGVSNKTGVMDMEMSG